MSPPTYLATDFIHRGIAETVCPGEIVPPTFTSSLGNEEAIDFERLLELGVVELVEAAKAKKASPSPLPVQPAVEQPAAKPPAPAKPAAPPKPPAKKPGARPPKAAPSAPAAPKAAKRSRAKASSKS